MYRLSCVTEFGPLISSALAQICPADCIYTMHKIPANAIVPNAISSENDSPSLEYRKSEVVKV